MSSRQKESFPPYHFIVTLPDRVYPFKTKVEGQWVRGMRSYDVALSRSFKKYGAGHYGYGLALYRQIFHFLGSLLVIYLAALLAYDLFDGRTALIVLLALMTLFITYQEFFLQRRIYRQLWRKAMADWCVWCIPMGLCFFFFS